MASVRPRLTKYLTSPSKVANALEWRKLNGSVLALNIDRKEIGLTLATHPSYFDEEETPEPIREKLTPIPLTFKTRGNRKHVETTVIDKLNNVVQTHKVCGFVVNWPLQKEGRIGASCGRVLHTLDSILNESKGVFTSNRKFCLWDGAHVPMEHDDAFGRCSIYGRPSTAEQDFVHVASREQYNQNAALPTLEVWNDFCKAHWPELYHDAAVQDQAEQPEGFASGQWLENYEQDGAYLQANAL